jgi:acetyl esterase/lipase
MVRRFSWFVGGGVLLLAALGWAPVPRAKVAQEADLVFGTAGEMALKLDLAWPAEGEGPFPAIVCIHGGGWVSGSRKQMTQTIEALAGRGYVAVAPDYRLAPKYRFPAQLEDCKAAVRWLRANAARYKVAPDRIGVMGLSAGAHLACLVGVTDAASGLEGNSGNPGQSSKVQAVVSFFGPTDLTRRVWSKAAIEKNLVPLLGGTIDDEPAAYRRASPMSYTVKDPPAFLFLHGSEDPVVPIEQSKTLADKLREAGGTARLITLEGKGHGWGGEKLLWSIAEMVAFFDEMLKQ